MNPIRTIRSLLLLHRDWQAAESVYRVAVTAATQAREQLRTVFTPQERVAALTRLADAYQMMARLHTAVYGADVTGDTDQPDRPRAQALELAALLLRMIGDAELSVGFGGQRTLRPPMLAALGVSLPLAAHAVLDAMAGEKDLFWRVDLLGDLLDEVEPAVGETAAELACLLSCPPMVLCWLCEGERWYPPAETVSFRLADTPDAAEGEGVACRACAANLDPDRILS